MWRALIAFPVDVLSLLSRQTPLLVGALTLSAAIAGGAYGLSSYLYERRVQEASDALKNLSFVISDHANRSMLAVNQSVSKVVERLEARRPESVAALETLADTPDMQRMLDDIVVENPFLDSVFVIGADGRVDQRSRFGMIPADVIAGGEFMGALQRARPGGFTLSAPFQSYQFRTWMLNFSRRVSGPNGAFLGAVSGIVKLSSFSDLFDKVNLESKGSIAMFSAEGRLLSWAPQAEMPFGPSVASEPFHEDFIRPRRDGVTRATSAYDHVERLLAIANAPDFPVSVVIGMGMPDVDVAWRGDAAWLGRSAALVILAILIGAARLAARIDRHARRRERAILDRQKVEQAETLAHALDNIVQGLAMFDPSGVLVLCNRRYAEMYGLKQEDLIPGVTREELQARLHRSGQAKAFERAIREPDGGTLAFNHLKDGRVIAQRKRMLPDGGWVSTHEDVTASRAAEARIHELSARDALTGLFNRFAFGEQLEKCLAEARDHGAKFALFHLDLDRFKRINEGLGPQEGDETLRQAAQRIRACLGPGDFAFRLGSDEFAVLQGLGMGPRDAERLAAKLIAALDEPFVISGQTFAVGASGGVCLIPAHGEDAATLVRRADLALQHARQTGRGRCSFFAANMRDDVGARLRLENDLRIALAARQFEMFYQPIISVSDRRPVAFEALIRWRHPERGLVSPADFIPIAEETGLIVEIGDWALREACRRARDWPAALKVAVNVSPVQFRAPGFVASVASALSESGLAGARLIAEITENVMIQDPDQGLAELQSLRQLGLSVSMDDFGTGYSSLSYLRKFPFDKVKIDKSFVGGLGADPSAATIVRAAIALAKALGIGCVAEGIETEEQMAFLAEAGCAEAQGYLISRPMPGAETDAFLAPFDLQRAEPARSSPPTAPLNVRRVRNISGNLATAG